MSEKELIRRLLETGSWGERAIKIGIRANFKCEYCGKNLINTLSNYTEWQEDHIIPLSKGGQDHINNIALSCRFCNITLKSRWNPVENAGEKNSRNELIEKVKEYIKTQRKLKSKKLNSFKKIIVEELYSQENV